MPVGYLYCDPQELSSYSHDSNASNSDEGEYAAAIEAASRMVDAWCGRRFFLDDAASARQFVVPRAGCRFLIDDFATVEDLEVKTDDDIDGTFETTWTITTDFRCAPFNRRGVSGETVAFYELISTGTRAWPFSCYGIPTVEVTAQWGWAQPVPEPVRRATLILAAKLHGLRGAPLGVAGFGEFGAVRVLGTVPDVVLALAPYRRYDVVAGL